MGKSSRDTQRTGGQLSGSLWSELEGKPLWAALWWMSATNFLNSETCIRLLQPAGRRLTLGRSGPHGGLETPR